MTATTIADAEREGTRRRGGAALGLTVERGA